MKLKLLEYAIASIATTQIHHHNVQMQISIPSSVHQQFTRNTLSTPKWTINNVSHIGIGNLNGGAPAISTTHLGIGGHK